MNSDMNINNNEYSVSNNTSSDTVLQNNAKMDPDEVNPSSYDSYQKVDLHPSSYNSYQKVDNDHSLNINEPNMQNLYECFQVNEALTQVHNVCCHHVNFQDNQTIKNFNVNVVTPPSFSYEI